jgi:hypothetical protein
VAGLIAKEVFMTNEMNTDLQIGQENIAPEQTVSNEAQAVAHESVEQAPVVEEKLIPQSQVSKIAAREKREAEQKALVRIQALEADKARLEEERRQWQAQQQTGNPGQLGGMQQYSEDHIKNLVNKEVEHRVYQEQQRLAQAHADQVVESYKQKIQNAMVSDPAFEGLYDAINVEQHPLLVLELNKLENTASVIKEMAENPAKFANVLMLLNGGSPKLAATELAKISNSIKQNEAAKKQVHPPEPLSQTKPSNISTSDGNLSVTDFRKMFRS